MTVNEEKDIILNALYGHFAKHRIAYDRVWDYLVEDKKIAHDRITTLLDHLCADGYIATHVIISKSEYWITHKGETLLEEHGGFVGKQQASQNPSINITAGRDIIGSPIASQFRGDFLFGKNAITKQPTTTPPIIENVSGSTTRPKSVIKRIWLWINEYKIIAGIISSIIAGTIMFFILKELNESLFPKAEHTVPKTDSVIKPK
jgi:DNA-binding PadR family transcriptional regulator